MGSIGLNAGRQLPAGLYVADRFAYFSADTVRDREGAVIPIEGLDLKAFANGIGVAGSIELPGIATYLTLAAAFPFAHATVNTDQPQAGLDAWGLGDVYVQPLRLGWRTTHVEALVSYALYIPTGLFDLGSVNVSRGHFTHEVAAGGTVFFDDQRRFFLSALASYDLNDRNRGGLDITRGDTVQIQGGVGATIFDIATFGVVGYALWQVEDDQGRDVPEVLRGARDRTFGLGGEASIDIAAIRGNLGFRYVHDLGVESRPDGQSVFVFLSLIAWAPEPASSEDPTPHAGPRAPR